MNPTDIVILVVSITLGTLLLIGVIFAIVFGGLMRLSKQRTAEAQQKYPGARALISNASFFGQQSRGVGQMRGSGTLILTDDDLIFEMWVPRRELRIPLRSISAVETPTSFLGKTRFKPLLKVVFQNESGLTDAAAWDIPDVEGMKRNLEQPR
jgi:hypothetical protein